MSVFGVGYVHAYEVYSHRRCEGVWAHVSKHVEVRGQPWTSLCVCVLSAEEGVGILGARVTGGCKSYNVGAGN